MYTFFGDILWAEVQSHSDDSHMHVTAPCSACALHQARPTMSCIHLVLWVEYAKYIMNCEFIFRREAGVSPQLHNVARVYATSPEGCFNICDEVTCSASHRACHPEAAAFSCTA